ncbi:MAG TPA: hypothetical protein PL009_05800 [Flavipsychrobacter sp.]|nr:hypothetical protein [Flavipsychrobacter sp.]
MRNFSTFLFVAVAALSISACSPRIYLPDRTNAPMLREAGEVKLTSSLKIQNNANAPRTVLSPSLDFAASPLKGLGIIASYRSTNRYANEEDFYNNYYYQDSIRYSGSRVEFGVGYYLPFGGRGLFDIYGGVGFGSIERSNQRGYFGNYDAKYFQAFLQPSIGFAAGDVFDMSGGMKINIHKYNNFKTDTISFRYEFTDPNVDIETPTFLMLGPFMNMNVGYKYAKFNMQFGANFNINKPHLRIETPFYLSMGITLAIAPRFWRGEERER